MTTGTASVETRAAVMLPSIRAILVITAALTCLLWLCILLFREPILGRADNGDQYRVLQDAGLQPQSATPFVEVRTRFHCAQTQGIPASTSSLVGLLIARPACRVVAELPMELFGAAYAAIHFLGVSLFLIGLSRSFGVRSFLLSASLLLIQGGHPYYISFFNSFFEEAAVIACATLVLGLSAFRAGRAQARGLELLSGLSLLALAFSKVVHVIFLPLLYWVRGRRAMMLGLCLAACATAAVQAQKASHFRTPNAYNRLFLGLLSIAPPEDAASVLGELGLEDFRGFSGRGYWPDGHLHLTELGKERVTDAGGILTVSGQYLSHPRLSLSVLAELVRRTAAASAEIPYLAMSNAGNWADASANSATGQVFFRALAQNAGWLALLALAVHLLIALALRDGYLIALGLLLAAYPAISLLGDGFYEFEKHLLLFLYATPLSMLLAFQALATRGTQSGVSGS